MKARQLDDDETENGTSIDSQENPGKATLTTKLERRRRIEELNEERRLREELNAF